MADFGLFLPVVVMIITMIVVTFFFARNPSKAPPKFLTKQRVAVPLIDKVSLSHDTFRFRFGLPEGYCLGLPIGQHVTLYAPNKKGSKEGEWNGRPDAESGEEEIERKYTPTSSSAAVGYFDLVIKVYSGGVKAQFPDGGKMSQYLGSLEVGTAHVEIKGPVGRTQYLGEGKFEQGSKELPQASHIGLLAGGTGLTPVLQVIEAVVHNPFDSTKLSLLYANQTEDDILLRDHLEKLQKEFPEQLRVWYTVDNPPENWRYSKGFITADMIKERLPPPSDKTIIAMCGPPPMIKFACQANLDTLGYSTSQRIAF